MDRIARKLSHRINTQVQNLQENLESLLDLDQWSPPPQKKQFEIKTNLQELKNIKLQAKQADDLFISLFSQLTPYFESGLLLYRKRTDGKKETWVHGAAFHEGVYFHIPEEFANLSLELPVVKKLELKKCAPYQLLSPLGLTELCDHSDSSAFVCKVHDLFTMILMTKLPEPWLRLHMESIHQFIEKTLQQNQL